MTFGRAEEKSAVARRGLNQMVGLVIIVEVIVNQVRHLTCILAGITARGALGVRI